MPSELSKLVVDTPVLLLPPSYAAGNGRSAAHIETQTCTGALCRILNTGVMLI